MTVATVDLRALRSGTMAKAKRKRAPGGSVPRRGAAADVVIRVRFTPTEAKAAKDYAAANGQDLSSTIRKALAQLVGDGWPVPPQRF